MNEWIIYKMKNMGTCLRGCFQRWFGCKLRKEGPSWMWAAISKRLEAWVEQKSRRGKHWHACKLNSSWIGTLFCFSYKGLGTSDSRSVDLWRHTHQCLSRAFSHRLELIIAPSSSEASGFLDWVSTDFNDFSTYR